MVNFYFIVDMHNQSDLNVFTYYLQEWSKHWFVLRGSALLFYRDPTAEDQGILDGVIDLSTVTTVNEVQVQRNYGFQITVRNFYLI